MRVLTSLAILAAAVCLASGWVRADDDMLLDRANAWKPGDPIPSELLHYRSVQSACIPVVPENVAAIFDPANDELLLAILFAHCDQGMFDCAVDAALLRMGARAFLTDLHARYAAHPELAAENRHGRLLAMTKRRQVTVDCLYVEDTAMPYQERDQVFARIGTELQAGASFPKVCKKYSDASEYSELQRRGNGTSVTLHLTHIGNNGDFVLSANNRRAINRAAEVPTEHVGPLLAAKEGDVLVLRNHAEHRQDLYFVREVYTPPAP